MGAKVIIVGGGLAGLTAAQVLLAGGATPLLLEAAQVFGGRIRTLADPVSGAALADLGPTWVWPLYQPLVGHWLRRLGLATFPQFNEGDGVLEGYGPGLRRQALPGQHGMERIAGGPGAIVAVLQASIGEAHLRAGAQVAAIAPDGQDGVKITLTTGETLGAHHVIVALPPRIAAGLAMPWAGADLVRALEQTPTWMAAQAKAVMLYDRPFWRAKGLSGRIASQTGPLAEVHDHCAVDGGAALFGFVGWPHAARAANAEGLRTAILDQLALCLGPEAGRPTRFEIEDWAQNSRIAAPLDLAQPPRHPEVRPPILREGFLGDRLWFGASEMALQSPGLIEGALSAGQAAAVAVLRQLATN